jgi:hypothetical protein
LLARVLRLQPGHKYCLLGELSKEVGWNYHETIKVRTIDSIARLGIYMNRILML